MAGQTQTPSMAAPTGTDSPKTPTPGTPTTSSLLFGFLLSFLVIFIVFMGCGLTSRYMVDRRRQRALTQSDLYSGTGRITTPTLWDVWTVPGEQNWKDMAPLAVQLRKDMPSLASTQAAQRRQPMLGEGIVTMYHEIKELAARLLTSPRRRSHINASARSSRSRTTDGKVDMQIAVLIAMPCPSIQKYVETTAENRRESIEGSSAETEEKNIPTMPDVAMGIATVPWDKQKTSFG